MCLVLYAARDSGCLQCNLDCLKTLALAGGVAANSGLRTMLEQRAQYNGMTVYVPPLSLCGDNAAMIGCQAFYEYQAGHVAGADLNAVATMRLDNVTW